jgi:ribonuclease Z
MELTLENPTGLDLTWLGTSSGAPSMSRNVSCCVVRAQQASYLVDCGEGTQRQILRTSIKVNKVHRIFITHMHGDHCFGLGGMLCTVANAKRLADDPGPIHVYGPPGLQEYVRTALQATDTELPVPIVVTEFSREAPAGPSEPIPVDRAGRLLFSTQGPDQGARPSSRELRFISSRNARRDIDIEEYMEGEALTWTFHVEDAWRVVAAELLHRVPCWGYVFNEPLQPGHVDVARAEALGVPAGPLLRDIKAGRAVTSPVTGKQVHPKDVLGPPTGGRKAVVLGDTWNSAHIAEAALGADVLVHEATFSRGTYGHICHI